MECSKKYGFSELVQIIAELRGENGCPWDKAQTHESLCKCLQEESQEVLDAIAASDDENLCEELGDVLLQVLLHSRIAEEEGRFTIDDVIQGLAEKMVRRHPHVFDERVSMTEEEQLLSWEEIKRREKEQRAHKYLDKY